MIKNMLQQQAMNAGNNLTNALSGYAMEGMDELLGIRKHRENVQLSMQDRLNKQQANTQMGLMNHANQLNKDFFDYSSPAKRVQQLKDAGLSIGLMYGGSGGGGSTVAPSGGGQVTGGHATTAGEMKANAIQMQGMALQNAKLNAEVKVLESQAEKNKADAGLSGAKTDTEDQQRNYLIGKLREEGVYYWLQNEINELKLGGDSTDVEVIKNKFLDRVIGKNSNSWAQQEITNALLKTVAETGKLDADKLLSSERAKAIWKELIIAQQHADNDTIKAKAQELAVNWGIGEYKNWKTWVDLGANALKTITSIIK